MKIKTSELTGAALDYAVAKSEEFKPATAASIVIMGTYCHSTNWVQGGPIIERESIALRHNKRDDYWIARVDTSSSEMMQWHWFWFGDKDKPAQWKGGTPLIAAMRCYVASRLGEEVEIPDSLI